MGVPNALPDRFGGSDIASKVRSGSFSVTGQSTGCAFNGDFNVSIWGTFTGSIIPERSFDGGINWLPFSYIDGSAISWSAPMSVTIEEFEQGVQWRLNCTLSSGAANWRISQ